MARYELSYGDTVWWLEDTEGIPYLGRDMIGNALDVELLRDGREAIITSDTIGCAKSTIVPADTIIKGFGSSREGKTLWEVTDTGVIYNGALRERAQGGELR